MFGHLDKAAFKKKPKTKTNKKQEQNWHMFHIETPILRGTGEEGHQLSFRVTDVQGHIYAGRGKEGVGRAGCLNTEIHSLFTGNPDQAFGVWTCSISIGPCPVGGGHPSVHLGSSIHLSI